MSLTAKVGRALDCDAGAVEHMGVNHGGDNVGMAQQFLHGADIISVFQQVRGK